MADKIENRHYSFVEGEIELRAATDGKKMITGEAIVYERESLPIHGMYIEIIKRGALNEADMSKVIARTNHDNGQILGTSWSGTLRLMDTASALRYEVDIPNTTAGRDTEALMERGDIAGSSFAFISDERSEKWIDRSEQGMLPILEVHKIKSLHDVSPVLTPAYPDAKSALRSFDAWKQRTAEEEAEKLRQVEEEKKLIADSESLAAIHSHKKYKK